MQGKTTSKLILHFIYGVVLTIFWGYYTLRSGNTKTQHDLVLIITVIAGVLINRSCPKNYEKVAFVLPCTIYLLLFYTTKLDVLEKLIHSFNIYFLGLLIFTFFKFKPIHILLGSVLLMIVQLELSELRLNASTPIYHKRFELTERTKSSKLSEFTFHNSHFDSIRLYPNGKPWVIETWAEWCPPCIQAIKELPGEIEKKNFDINFYYLYSDKNYQKIKDKTDVFNFPLIVANDNIIVSENRVFEQNFSLDQKPSFIFFNKEGVLDTIIKGYDQNQIINILSSQIKH